MKCNNCDTINAPNATKCISCNIILEGSIIAQRDKTPIMDEGELMCKNCSTINAIQSLRCTNCNASLDGSMVIYNKQYRKKENAVTENESGKDNVTLHTEQASIDTKMKPNHAENNGCHKCGYMNRSESSICVQCGATLSIRKIHTATQAQSAPVFGEKVQAQNVAFQEASHSVNTPASTPKSPESSKEPPNMGQEFIGTATVNPWATQKKVGFKLTPLQLNDSSHISELFYAGNEVVLNRANLENDNTTISSQAHATIKQEDGKWFISDQSSQQTTFIRVGHKLELTNGDVILIGNRLFSFKSE